MKSTQILKKRAQSSMDFLASYGWEIVVILTSIAALAYFGVLNPAKFLPDRCVLGPEIGCQSLSSGVGNTLHTTTFFLHNNLQVPINITSITLQEVNCTDNNLIICSADRIIRPDRTIKVDMLCDKAGIYKKGTRFNSDIIVKYDKIGGFEGFSARGVISTTLDEGVCKGDFTGDGIVDFQDLGYLSAQYNTSDPAADFNCDGIVDMKDVDILRNSYNNRAC